MAFSTFRKGERNSGIFKLPIAVLNIGLCLTLFIINVAVSMAHAQPLRIVTISVTPFGMVDDEGNNSGIAYETGNRIAEEAGLDYKNIIVPYPRAVSMIKTGNADLLIALSNPQLDESALRVTQVSELNTIVLGKRGVIYDSIESLHGAVIAAVREAEYDTRLSGTPQIEIYGVNNYEAGLKMVLKGRVDGFVGLDLGIAYVLKEGGVSLNSFGKPYLLNSQKVWLHVSRKTYDDDIAEALKAATIRMREGNEIRQIEEKYTQMEAGEE